MILYGRMNKHDQASASYRFGTFSLRFGFTAVSMSSCSACIQQAPILTKAREKRWSDVIVLVAEFIKDTNSPATTFAQRSRSKIYMRIVAISSQKKSLNILNRYHFTRFRTIQPLTE